MPNSTVNIETKPVLNKPSLFSILSLLLATAAFVALLVYVLIALKTRDSIINFYNNHIVIENLPKEYANSNNTKFAYGACCLYGFLCIVPLYFMFLSCFFCQFNTAKAKNVAIVLFIISIIGYIAMLVVYHVLSGSLYK